eukprot:TRINITY_DN11814_c0_g2_i3.p2 TRINITY_DN11814_c0_g2~~TRINITY_DN11814_c0_g2_i3.p2  ORF type:complete len:296 (+),score=20.05 TRINITY_DN11814_c0_g2_i3:3615-4502(+)
MLIAGALSVTTHCYEMPKMATSRPKALSSGSRRTESRMRGKLIRPEIWRLASICAHTLGHDDTAAFCLRKACNCIAKPLARGYAMLSMRGYPSSMGPVLEAHDNYLLEVMLNVTARLLEEQSRELTDNYLLSITHLVAAYYHGYGRANRMLHNEIGMAVRSAVVEVAPRASPDVVQSVFQLVNRVTDTSYTIKRNGRCGSSLPPDVALVSVLGLIDHVHAGKEPLQVGLRAYDWLCFFIVKGQISEEVDICAINERLAHYGYSAWQSLADKFHRLDKNYIRINHDFELMRRLLED